MRLVVLGLVLSIFSIFVGGQTAVLAEELSWKGGDARPVEQYAGIITHAEEWKELWQRAFEKSAPEIDFDKYVVACVFLGKKADWLYSIKWGEPVVKDGEMIIPYWTVMLVLELSPDADTEKMFRGQYSMKAFARKPGSAVTIRKMNSD